MKKLNQNNPKAVLRSANRAPVEREFLKSLKKDLVLYMEARPAFASSLSVSPAAPVSPYWFAKMSFATAMAFLLLGGGAVLASQNSLPGDGLYPVKILAERVRIAGAFAPEARIETRLELAQVRMNEIWELSLKSAELPSETEAGKSLESAVNNFNSQLAGAFEEMEKLKEDNSDKLMELASDIKAAAEVYEQIISTEKERSGDAFKSSFDRLAVSSDSFKSKADSVIEDLRESSMSGELDEDKAEKKLEVSRSKIDEAKRAVETKKESVPVIFREKLEDGIKNAEARFNEARGHFDKKELKDASKEANESIESAASVQALIKASSNLSPETFRALNQDNRGSRGSNKDEKERNENKGKSGDGGKNEDKEETSKPSIGPSGVTSGTSSGIAVPRQTPVQQGAASSGAVPSSTNSASGDGSKEVSGSSSGADVSTGGQAVTDDSAPPAGSTRTIDAADNSRDGDKSGISDDSDGGKSGSGESGSGKSGKDD